MIQSFIPILAVDMLGSIAMVIISLLCLYKAKVLRNHDPDNAVFLYLLWISLGFAVFAVSRSFGHILKQILILASHAEAWQAISPYSGSVNTVSFMLVGLITLFFQQSWNINEKILAGRKKLEDTHVNLIDLNQTLENKVIERTERLTSSEHKARRIFEQSLDTIVVTDEKFNIAEINPAGISLTGYKKTDMLKNRMGFRDFMADQSEWKKLKQRLEDDEFILNEETDFLRPDQSKVRVLITGSVDYGAFGCGKTFHFIIKDINDKKQMEQQIAQADKLAALGELSAGVAHEINNPLGIILGYAQLMLKEETPFQDDLKIIEKHVKNCKTVVSDLLVFSRKGTTGKKLINIKHTIEGVLNFFKNHSDFNNVEINVKISEKAPLNVYGSEQELRQVIINLMINACHAVDKKGIIEVEAFRGEDDQIFISVKDNGTGIRKKYFSRIFDPFFTTKPVGQGTGLGLSVGYGIIQRHGGDITFRNREVKGAAFMIRLPAAETGSLQKEV